MRLTNAERQKKHREKMKKQNLSLVRVWVPKDKVMEIKSMALRFVKESLRNEIFFCLIFFYLYSFVICLDLVV